MTSKTFKAIDAGSCVGEGAGGVSEVEETAACKLMITNNKLTGKIVLVFWM